MGVCVERQSSLSSENAVEASRRRSGTAPPPLPVFEKQTSTAFVPAAAATTPASIENHASMSSDKPFADYDYHVWSDTQQNTEKASKAEQPAQPAQQHQQRSSSIAVLQRISMQRLSTSAEKVTLLEDLQSGRNGERRPSHRFSIGGRSRRLSSSLNEVYAQLNSVAPRQVDEEKLRYLQRIFKLIDTKSDGKVSAAQLAKSLFNATNRAVVDVMMAAADHDKDGHLSESEFVSFFIHVEDGNSCLQADQNDATAASRNSTSSDETATPGLSVASVQQLDATSHVAEKKGTFRMRAVEVAHLASQANRIKCIALSQDGALYAVAHRHDSIAHVCTLDGVEMRRLVGHQDSLLGIAFSPDCKHVYTAARDSFLVSWDRTVGLECCFFEHPGIVTAVAMSWDGRFTYSGCQDNLVRKLTASKAKVRAVLPKIPCDSPGVIVALSTQHTKNDNLAFSRSCDQCAYICDANNLQLVAQLSGHESLVWQASFNADDSLLLTCCEQKVILWDGNSFASMRVYNSATFAPAYPAVEEVLWTTAIFGGKDLPSLMFCFNSAGQMHMLSCHDETGGVSLLDLQLRSSVYTASCFVGNTMVCGDDNGNVYRIRIT